MPDILTSLDKSKLKIKVGRFMTDKCGEALKEKGEFFLSNVDNKQAWRLKKSLSKKMDKTVLAYPARYDDLDGYLFRLVQ